MRMLTGMSPIAAGAAHTATPALNTASYATAATVIPVLFLGLAVQGGTYENLMKAFGEAFRRWMVPGRWLGTNPHSCNQRPPTCAKQRPNLPIPTMTRNCS